MRPYVKFCGNTRKSDLDVAVDSRANAVGFLVGLNYSSEDEVSPDHARELARVLPPFVVPVLVTHRASLEELKILVEETGFSHVQIHGPAPVEIVAELSGAYPDLRIIKAVHVEPDLQDELVDEWAGLVHALLLDTRTGERLGGTGQVHDWGMSRRIRDRVLPTPVILAGGLTPTNVAQAIREVKPFGVDVNSGISQKRGIKSKSLAIQFAEAVLNQQ